VLAESVDYAKTFGEVYGVGAAGDAFDAEIMTYMNGYGWSPREQVSAVSYVF
jgi:hypothetical protein